MTSDHKPRNQTWQGFADQKIREAEEQGLFANLPGLGQPIPGIDDPLDENWWVKQKLREEGLSIVPPVLEARLARERVLASLDSCVSEQEVRERLTELNAKIRAALRSPTAGPADGVSEVDVEATVAKWRQRADPRTVG